MASEVSRLAAGATEIEEMSATAASTVAIKASLRIVSETSVESSTGAAPARSAPATPMGGQCGLHCRQFYVLSDLAFAQLDPSHRCECGGGERLTKLRYHSVSHLYSLSLLSLQTLPIAVKQAGQLRPAVETPSEVAMGEAEVIATKLMRRRASILKRLNTAMAMVRTVFSCVDSREGGEGRKYRRNKQKESTARGGSMQTERECD